MQYYLAPITVKNGVVACIFNMSSIKNHISGVIYYKEFNIPNTKQTIFQPFPQMHCFHNGHCYYLNQLGNLKNQQSSQIKSRNLNAHYIFFYVGVISCNRLLALPCKAKIYENHYKI
jgi:hypothetical protein